MRILLLGGSTEASGLARAIAGDRRFEAILSLVGRTAIPRTQPIRTRTGGFGGVEGLAGYLRDEAIHLIVDATHPFAGQMSRHAIEAASITATPLLAIERPAWEKRPGDSWIEVANIASAMQALGSEARTVFCAIGGLAIGELQAAPQHTYIIRLIDAPTIPVQLPSLTMIEARGPFRTADDIALFEKHRIEAILAKNSGGNATVSKIEAARVLKLPVIMIERPYIPPRPSAATVEEALVWLHRHHENSVPRGV